MTTPRRLAVLMEFASPEDAQVAAAHFGSALYGRLYVQGSREVIGSVIEIGDPERCCWRSDHEE